MSKKHGAAFSVQGVVARPGVLGLHRTEGAPALWFQAPLGGLPLTQVGFFLARPEKGEEEKRTGEYAHQVA